MEFPVAYTKYTTKKGSLPYNKNATTTCKTLFGRELRVETKRTLARFKALLK